MKHSWEIDWGKVDLSRDSRVLAEELDTGVVVVNMAKMPFLQRALVTRHPEYFEPGFFMKGKLQPQKSVRRVRKSLLDL